MWYSRDNVESSVCRLTCGTEPERDRGTAFLISPNLALTATHNISRHLKDQTVPIVLEFLNIGEERDVRIANPVVTDIQCPVTVLQLDDAVYKQHLVFSTYPIDADDDFEIFGYPVVKWSSGQWTRNKISRVLNKFNPYDWNIDLNHQSKIEDFSGLSGAPLLVEGQLVGVLLTETMENGKAISLGAVSLERFLSLLAKLQIETHEYIDPYSYQPAAGEYRDFVFVEKLEAARITEHEICETEFYHAEILTNIIKSKTVKGEMRELNKLKEDIRGLWYTQYVGYTDENDGAALLSSVYERVEDHNTSTLSTGTNISLYAKKGILHQWADDCKVGWVKNYKRNLTEYRETKEDMKNDGDN